MEVERVNFILLAIGVAGNTIWLHELKREIKKLKTHVGYKENS